MLRRNLMVLGVTDTGKALAGLPLRVIVPRTGEEAIRCLYEEHFEVIISLWDLVDMPDGTFLKRVKEAKHSTATIAMVRCGDTSQEISARVLGVDAVLSDNVGDKHLREVVCQLLRIPGT